MMPMIWGQGARVSSDLGVDLLAWNSIPYATPPLGELRYTSSIEKHPICNSTPRTTQVPASMEQYSICYSTSRRIQVPTSMEKYSIYYSTSRRTQVYL
jgi:carboxylesterase type B